MFGATPAENSTISVENKQSNEHVRHESSFCAWLWISHDPPRIEASARTNICFHSMPWVNQSIPVAERLNRSRLVQTIEWVNSAQTSEARMPNRKKTKWKYRLATHAHFNCPCLIHSFHCLHRTRTVDFAATGVLVYQQDKYQNKCSFEPMLSFGQFRCHAQNEGLCRHFAFDCLLSTELDDFHVRECFRAIL